MSIDDRLQELANTVYQHGKATRTNTPFHYGEPIAQAKQALYKDMLELLGEDEPVDPKDKHEVIQMQLYANTTRQKLRNKLRKYYGAEE